MKAVICRSHGGLLANGKEGKMHGMINQGHNPLNQTFRAEVWKFLGVKWIATGPNSLVPFHSQILRSFKKKGVGPLLLVLKLDEDFDGDINDIVLHVAASFRVI